MQNAHSACRCAQIPHGTPGNNLNAAVKRGRNSRSGRPLEGARSRRAKKRMRREGSWGGTRERCLNANCPARRAERRRRRSGRGGRPSSGAWAWGRPSAPRWAHRRARAALARRRAASPLRLRRRDDRRGRRDGSGRGTSPCRYLTCRVLWGSRRGRPL